ncbi:hypothetical protein QAD02_019349 [Eretmocerus hayati]|uniref:Uncharacterized protein n=1 Tax=Eretmocerus hayati TaxID=131215 RepID=A0ACC2PJL6_9HYME|nr:hypothetical protein QAD02_019349 [Eretmocerus hayati]
MIYASEQPWLYGTVRASPSGSCGPRHHLIAQQHRHHQPLLLVCSCPDFLHGTTRDFGTNCPSCGGHRLAGLAAIGGTCRMPTTTIRARPSLAGMLKPSSDDPYDLMRRSRLSEPRSRARSTSPLRQLGHPQRSSTVCGSDLRSQSAARAAQLKVATVEPMSRSEWYDCSPLPSPTTAANGAIDQLIEDACKQSPESKDSEWVSTKSQSNINLAPTSSIDDSTSTLTSSDSSRKSILECDVNPYLLLKKQQQRGTTTSRSTDRLRQTSTPSSTLNEDEVSSDDLSDNALEDLQHEPTCGLFDPSKVKSIERIPSTGTRSSVAAIGGQRVRVFNEQPLREASCSDEDDHPQGNRQQGHGQQLTLTRIPIPKVSPKRPPRRLKEARSVLKSILKRRVGDAERNRKSVLFNVDNVILAPEKPAEIAPFSSPQRKVSKSSPPPMKEPPPSPPQESSRTFESESRSDTSTHESSISQNNSPQPLDKPRRFITIPNIKSPKTQQQQHQQQQSQIRQPPEAKVAPRVKSPSPAPVEKIKIDKFVPSKKQQILEQRHQQQRTDAAAAKQLLRSSSDDIVGNGDAKDEVVERRTSEDRSNVMQERLKRTDEALVGREACDKSETTISSEIEVQKESTRDLEPIVTGEQNVIDESKGVTSKDLGEANDAEENTTTTTTTTTSQNQHQQTSNTCLTRSQSDRSTNRPEMCAADVNFVDTMRLSFCRRAREDEINKQQREDGTEKINSKDAEVVERRTAIKRESKLSDSSLMGARIDEEGENHPEIRQEGTRLQNKSQSMQAVNIDDHFGRMRPTSWSPPPSGNAKTIQRNSQTASNICKITVSPTSPPPPVPTPLMVHRLQVSTSTPLKGSRGTSILINGEQQSRVAETTTSDSDNKVTISVGGQSNGCNSTVISVNSNAPESPSNIQMSNDQRRTLVIFDNYKSNIVIGGDCQEQQQQDANTPSNECRSSINTRPTSSTPIEIRTRPAIPQPVDESCMSPDSSPRWRSILSAPSGPNATGGATKEELISKLLEDSLRKARENGEILDESSGEAILKILKQSLLKSSATESTCSSSSSRIIGDNNGNGRKGDLSSSPCLFGTTEENAYEVIKEPIYEEIPDEPPPLPLSPPPSEDFLKNRIFFGDEYKHGFRDLNSGTYYKPLNNNPGQYLECSYLSKSPEDTFNKSGISNSSMVAQQNNLTSKFELLNFIMDSKERTRADLEALYEQKETSLGDLSSKSSQISNVSDSSEECNLLLANSTEVPKTRTVDIERTDSGVGSESSQASSGRGRWRLNNNNNSNNGNGNNNNINIIGSNIGTIGNKNNSNINSSSAIDSGLKTGNGNATQKNTDVKHCEDCEQRIEPLVVDSGFLCSHLVCRKCGKKRAERKEIITEIVETEQKYGRDLQIILDEFHRPMLRAGLLTQEQLSAIFLNVEELLEHNHILAEKLKDAVDIALESGDEDLVTVDLGKIFLESERMLHAFESYCTRQGGASLLLQNLEKEKELLRIFLKVSQMENTVLRRMNLNSFLMVPVQRVTKYPLLLARLLKATPSGKSELLEVKKRLKQAQTNIELHLEHMNAEAKDITSTKLWRRISIIQNGRRSTGEQDMVNIKLRKMAVEVLEWAHEDSRFVLEGRLLVAQPTDNNWRRGRTVKLAPVTAMLVTNGKPNEEFVDCSDESLFPKQIGIKEATLLLVKEKLGRYSLLREPLYLDKCIVCCEADLEDYFEIQELSSKETFIFKAEDGARTKRWCRTLQAHAQSLGAWRKRRGALPNIMICGVARN